MTKYVTTTIGEQSFEIEQDAYLVLRTYIKSFEDHFENTENAKLIVENIEMQIAEWFINLQTTNAETIQKETVDFVKMKVGAPHEIEITYEDMLDQNRMGNDDEEQEVVFESRETSISNVPKVQKN